MLTLTRELTEGEIDLAAIVTGTLTLPFEMRQRTRLRTRLDDGSEVALILPRGSVLRPGSVLADGGDARVFVRAAREALSIAHTDDPRLIARACYLIGNRHVPLQIGEGWIAWPRDPVLDDMVLGLGLVVTATARAFVPEAGAPAPVPGAQGPCARGHEARGRGDMLLEQSLEPCAASPLAAREVAVREVATLVASTVPATARQAGGRPQVPVRAAAQWW